jgi:hypothetical protein
VNKNTGAAIHGSKQVDKRGTGETRHALIFMSPQQKEEEEFEMC